MNTSAEQLRGIYISSNENSFEVCGKIVRDMIHKPSDLQPVDDVETSVRTLMNFLLKAYF